jgi:NADPH-ferrihemoprotein reductase
VSEALKRLSYDGKQGVRLTTRMGSKLPPTIFEGKAISIRDLLSHFLDIQSPPRKNSLVAMASCARDLKEQRRLEYLASAEGRDEYRSYVLDNMRSLVEVLEDFPSVKPSLGVFAARIAPKLQPRFYSISSSPLAHPDKIHITCAVVEGESPTGRSHKGVASTWLSRCKPSTSKVPVFIRKSTFKMPKDKETPIVMVGPGTGFAPFRGFLQDREAQMKMGETNLGEAHLYFGCRSKAKDFIYEEEIKAWKEASVITDVEYAFSRDQAKKVYVQDHIRKNGKQIYDLLFGSGGAYLYVCGDAKLMARDVNITLHEIVQQYGSCSATEAELKIKAMQEEGRYLRDVW